MHSAEFSKQFRWVLPQFLAAFTASIGGISDGMHYGWAAPIIPILESPNSPIPIRQVDVVWLENIFMIGAFAVLPIAILCVDKLGRKISICLTAIINLVSWTLIAFGSSIEYLYVARFLGGMADGLRVISEPMYLGEIADKKIRGLIGSFYNINLLIGIVVVYAVAPFVSIAISSAVGGVFVIIQLFTFPFMPDSPYFLLLKGNTDAARKSLENLRYNKDVDSELQDIAAAIKRQQSERGRLIDLFIIKSNRMAFLIMTVLNFSMEFSGSSVMVMNMHSILDDAAIDLTPSTASIIFSVLMLVSALLTASLSDKVGRKTLLISSAVLTSIILFILASYFTIKNLGTDVSSYNWIPVVCVVFYAITIRYGIGMIPSIMIGEIFPTSVKAIGMTLACVVFIISSVTSIYVHQVLQVAYGLHVPFFIFAGCCCLTAIFAIFFVPETKGKTLEEIQQILKGNSLDISKATVLDCNNSSGEQSIVENNVDQNSVVNVIPAVISPP